LAGIILPSITAEELRAEALERMLRILNSMNLLIISFMAITATWLVPLVFGHSFHAAAIPLILLLPGMLFLSAQTLLASYFAGKGLLQINLTSAVLSLTIALVLDFTLIPRLGAAGAAVASTISYAVGCIFVYLRYCNKTSYPWQHIMVNKQDIHWMMRTAKGYLINFRTP
jgi:O-antigen/teichoic acid export membrane protein